MGVTIRAEYPLRMDICVDHVHQESRAPGGWTSHVDCTTARGGGWTSRVDSVPQVSWLQRRAGAPQAILRGPVKGWGKCSQVHLDLQLHHHKGGEPSLPASGPKTRLDHPRRAVAPTSTLLAHALTVLDDRDVNWRGAGYNHNRVLGGHG